MAAPVVAISANEFSFIVAASDGAMAVSSDFDFDGSLDFPSGPPRFFTSVAAGVSHFAAIYDSLVAFGALDPAGAGRPQTFTLTNSGTQPLHLGDISITGPGASHYILNTVGLSPTLAPGANATLNISTVPGAGGPDGATLEIPSDSSAMPKFTVRLANSAPAAFQPPYLAWKLRHFGTAADTGDSADNADPNHNGIPNLLEYALGGDPTTPGPETDILPAVTSLSWYGMQFRIPHPTSAPGVTLTIQACEGKDASGALTWSDLAVSKGGFFSRVSSTQQEYQINDSSDTSGHAVALVKVYDAVPFRMFRLVASRP